MYFLDSLVFPKLKAACYRLCGGLDMKNDWEVLLDCLDLLARDRFARSVSALQLLFRLVRLLGKFCEPLRSESFQSFRLR